MGQCFRRQRSERHEHLKKLEKSFQTLKLKEKEHKGRNYNAKDREEASENIFIELQKLTESDRSDPDPDLNFKVVQTEELQNLKQRNSNLEAENIRYRREKNSLQEKYNEQETKAIKNEEKVKRLQEMLEGERSQGEEEIRSLRLQIDTLEENRKDWENEKKNMQSKIIEKELAEKELGMECTRLQGTMNKERIKMEEERRSLNLQLGKLMDLEKENKRTLNAQLDQKEEFIEDLKRNIKAKQHEIDRAKSQVEMQKDSIAKLNKYLSEERKAKENALNRLSAAAANRLRDQNPGITDLSDPNRPLKLAEKVSELYDNEWTNAIENLEDMKVEEEKGIKILLKIIQNVFDKCSGLGDAHLRSFPDLLVLPPTIYQLDHDRVLSVEKMSSDLLKPMKDFRKSNAKHAITCLKEYFVNKEGQSKLQIKKKYLDPCKEYIEKCVELCWMMRVQDPPIYMDASYKTNSQFDSTKMRSFTKAGQFIQFVVWPTFFLHKDGPLLAKGVVQGSKIKVTQEESCSSSSDSSEEEEFDDARSDPAAKISKDDAEEGAPSHPENNEPTASNGENFDNSDKHEGDGSTNPEQNETLDGGSTNGDDVQSSGGGQEEKGKNKGQQEEEEEDAKSSSSEQANETSQHNVGNQGGDSDTKAARDGGTKPTSQEKNAVDKVDNNTAPSFEVSVENTGGNVESKSFASKKEENSTGGCEGEVNKSFTDEQVLDP